MWGALAENRAGHGIGAQCHAALQTQIIGQVVDLTSYNPFHAGHLFRGFPVHAFATACQVARPPVRIKPIYSATDRSTSHASNGVGLPCRCWVWLQPATGFLYWRDSHALEWQLASLHQIVAVDGDPAEFAREASPNRMRRGGSR